MARVVGLDIGSHSLKSVVVESSLRGVVVKSYTSVTLTPGADKKEQMSVALSELAAQGALAGDSVVVAPWGSQLATHSLELPFRETKKIESALGFEVEGLLPVDLSEVVYDYQPSTSEHTEGDTAQLLVGVIRKNALEEVLATLKTAKCDPRVVSHSGLVLQFVLAQQPVRAASLGEAAPGEEAQGIAIVDLGHERTCVSIGRAGEPVERTRIFPGGGLALDKALSAEFSIGVPEARAWKEQYAVIGAGVNGPDAERAERVCLHALQPILREVRLTLKSYEAQSKRPIGQLLLCGGTAKLKGLAARLEQELRVPTSVVEAAAEIRSLMPQAGAESVQAWALAMRGTASGAKVQRFNLRKDEFVFKSDFDFVKQRIGTLAAFAGVLFLLLVASGLARNFILEQREKKLDAELCETTKRILGTCEKDFKRALNLLEGKESPAAGIPQYSATTLLAELTQRVPADMAVTLDQIQVDLDRISVRCETNSNKNIEDLMAALKTYKCFQEITEGKVEKNKDGSKVTTRLEIQVACNEPAPTP